MNPITNPDNRAWAAAFAAVAVVIAGLLTRGHSLFPWAVSVAAIIGGAIGWRLAGHVRVMMVVAKVRAIGDVETLLDRVGREMLTVWIPLDHNVTDDDKTFARQIGELFNTQFPGEGVAFVAVETFIDRVGMTVVGRDADTVLEQIRPFFKQHCPGGTYVSMRRVCRGEPSLENPTAGNWPKPRPLFEDEELPEDVGWPFPPSEAGDDPMMG